jgi:SAM-dependent methyltransferase
MIDLSGRAQLTELMDSPCDFRTFRDCLVDLAKVNRLTLAYRPTLQWLQQFAGMKDLAILDVGSGYGDMLRRIERRYPDAVLTGVDLNPYSAQAARQADPNSRIAWKTSNAFDYSAGDNVDVIVSSLFTHHLDDAEVVAYLRWMEATARRGWFVNDLLRHGFAYHGFKLLARLMRWHRFVQSDGPISILRSFRPDDWQRLCREAGLPVEAVRIERRFPFRLCVSRVKP